MRFEDQRQILVNELKAEGISDPIVLKAFNEVPREHYVLPEYREYAYQNRPLPLSLQQTISQPLMIAIMLQYLQLKPDDIVLEIGTGSGYQSALLAEIVKEVCSVERLETLSLNAQKVLRARGYKHIHFRIGDGNSGWEKAFPPYKEFNKIVVSAGADNIPPRLTDQLAEGGIMAIPVGEAGMQVLNVITRKNGLLSIQKAGACAFVPLIKDDQPMR